MSKSLKPMASDSVFPTESDGHLNEVFQSIPLSAFPPPPSGKVITYLSDMPAVEVIKDMAKHGFLSAPIINVDAPADSTWLDKYLGTVDSIGLLYWLLDKCEKAPDTLQDLLEAYGNLQTSIGELVGADPESLRFGAFVPVDPNKNSMLDVMLLLGRYALHRVFVVASLGDILSVVTQSGVVDVLNSNLEKLAPLATQSIADLGLLRNKPMLTVPVTVTLWEGLNLLRKARVSAAPVVDAAGKIAGTLSATDARELLADVSSLAQLNTPLQVLKRFGKQPFDITPITAKPTDSLGECVQKLGFKHGFGRIHRLWVVDEEGRPVHCLALREVIARFVKEPSEDYFGNYFCV